MPTWRQTRCLICDVLVDNLEYRNHLKAVHPSYEAWRKKTTRNVIAAEFIVIGLLVALILFSPGNELILFPVMSGFAVILAISFWYSVMIRKRFRLSWKDQNPEGTQSNAS
jgi:hypothetical protein